MANLLTSRSVTFIDIETTHLDPKYGTILSIAIITDWENGKKDVWSTKIKPKDIEMEFASKTALKICKYNPEDWDDAPSFEDVSCEIAKRLEWGPIVGHNIQFDLSHIKSVFKRFGWRQVDRLENNLIPENRCFKIGYPIIDTCALAFIFTPSERQNLSALRQFYEIDEEGRAHNALADAEDCRQIFYNIVNMIKD
jgi:DNA polymerase III epsilon subunit-like protein